MDTLTEIFPNLVKYLELMPVTLMGLLSGIVSYFNNADKDSSNAYKQAVKNILTCAFITIIMYSILAATDLPYLAKVGISCAVGFFGVDKAIEIAQTLIAMRGSRTTEQVDKPRDKRKRSDDES